VIVGPLWHYELKALADPTGLRLVSTVPAHEGGEARFCDLTEPLELTTSHRRRILIDAGIFTRDKRPIWAYQILGPSHVLTCTEAYRLHQDHMRRPC
jgi:hypothetical protein